MTRYSVRNRVCAFSTPIGSVSTKVAVVIGAAVNLFFAIQLNASAANGDVSDAKHLLLLYQKLAVEPTLVPDQMPRRFGWLVRRFSFEKKTDRVDFSFGEDTTVSRLNFDGVAGIHGESLNMMTQIAPSSLCIKREDVTDVLGMRFKPTMAIYEPYPDAGSISDEVKVNRKLFFFGPEYEYQSALNRTTLTVTFNFSACAESITLHRIKAKQ
jgi:hypothetical protein